MSKSPKILVLDIETSPNLAYVWRLFKENVSLAQLRETGQVISFAAKWHGTKRVEFDSVFDFSTEEMTGGDSMVNHAWELMNEADMIVHYNGTSFDIPHLNREFLLRGLTPPSPHKNIDLLTTMRKRFRFVSNKLDHVAQQMGVGAKVSHTGFDLWRRCMEGDPAAWRMMRTYNKGDVVITDKVYTKALPWIVSHPHMGLYSADPETPVCGKCNSTDLVRQGHAFTSVGKFQRFRCNGCGGWSRGKNRVDGVTIRPHA